MGFGNVTALDMLQHIFRSYGPTDKIYLEENAVKMMGPYDPAEPLARLTNQLEKGWESEITGGKNIVNGMMVSKGITLLAQPETLNEDIREWIRQSTKINK